MWEWASVQVYPSTSSHSLSTSPLPIAPRLSIPSLAVPPDFSMAFPAMSLGGISDVDGILAGVTVVHGDVDIVMNSMTYVGSTANVYDGFYDGQRARFTEYRQLACHTESGIDVRRKLIAYARLRQEFHTSRHVRVAGIYLTGDALARRMYLVEAPCSYTGLKEYLTANANVDRVALVSHCPRPIVCVETHLQ
ncbi:hypothetical protein NMY22_g15122 [Coprinellus aureogranulatus]|nr:hypothetical protein NMY22_g15122 [Coprinellus aureogranulatus]